MELMFKSAINTTKIFWQYGIPGKTTAVMMWAAGVTVAAMIFMEAFLWTTVLMKAAQ